MNVTRQRTSGTSLIELLVAMALLSVIFLLLSTTLDVALQQFRNGADRSDNHQGAEIALGWMRRDLASALTERPANVAPLPPSVSDTQRDFFGGKLFFPIEINRESGTGLSGGRSFVNAETAFDSLAFVARIPVDAQFSAAYERARRGHASGDIRETAISWETMARASVLGYYVAYTHASPLAGERPAAMRLHRHYRPGDSLLAQGYASGLLLHLSGAINDRHDEFPGAARPANEPNPAAVRRGEFANDRLPFLFSRFVDDPATLSPAAAVQPWPAHPLPGRLAEPPPDLHPDRGSAAAWANPQSSVHDTVFPDEPIAHNVVRFEIRPYRFVETESGSVELMDAAALNDHLGLAGGEEWPCLVTPSRLEVTLGVIGESAARQLDSPADWIVDWSRTDPSQWSDTRRLIESELRTHHCQIHLTGQQ